MPLTDTAIKKAKSADTPTKLSDGKGMYLEALAAGGKYWRMKYRHAGKEKRLALGVYPAVSLAQARKARDQAHCFKLEFQGVFASGLSVFAFAHFVISIA